MLPQLLVALFACSSLGSARPIPHSTRLYRRFTFETKPSPQHWATVQLEDYDQYHFRYLDIGCHLHHSTAFFTACCHPRKKSSSPADYPAQCSLSPSSLQAAASIVAQSIGAGGKVKAGEKGKPVHVQAGKVVALKPIKVNGKATEKPPTAAQLKAYAKAEAALSDSPSRPKPVPSPTTPSTSSSSLDGQSKAQAAAATAAASAKAKAQAEAQAQAQAGAQASKSAAATAAQQSASASAAAAEKAKEEAQAQAQAQAAATAAAAAKAKAEAEAQAQAAAEKTKQQEQQQQQHQQQQQQQQQQQSQSQQSSGGGGGGFLAGIQQIFGVGGGAHATFFYQNGVAGACGTVHSDSTPLIALPSALYDGGSHCGQTVKIVNPANGKSVVATVQDLCPTCTTSTSIDLSVGAFTQIATEDQGQVDIQWGFAN